MGLHDKRELSQISVHGQGHDYAADSAAEVVANHKPHLVFAGRVENSP